MRSPFAFLKNIWRLWPRVRSENVHLTTGQLDAIRGLVARDMAGASTLELLDELGVLDPDGKVDRHKLHKRLTEAQRRSAYPIRK